ncbi:MAG: hypothetical protein JJT82_08095 [Legionellaceae bacterium]|nr:hypothetical protein [Legionellaceae bacterium]
MRLRIFDFDQTITIKHTFKNRHLTPENNLKANIDEVFKHSTDEIAAIATYHDDPEYILNYVAKILQVERATISLTGKPLRYQHANLHAYCIPGQDKPLLISALPKDDYNKHQKALNEMGKNTQIAHILLYLTEHYAIQPQDIRLQFYDDSLKNCQKATYFTPIVADLERYFVPDSQPTFRTFRQPNHSGLSRGPAPVLVPEQVMAWVEQHVSSAIARIEDYGAQCNQSPDSQKGQRLTQLAADLKAQLRNFLYVAESQDQYKLAISKTDYQQFEQKCTALLHQHHLFMKEHRALWKPIVANMLLALTGIGFIFLAVKTTMALINAASRQQYPSLHDCLFFSKSQSQQHCEQIEHSLADCKSRLLSPEA